MERIRATYYIETPYSPEKAASILAGEQSSGTFVAVPGETEELKQRFAAGVKSVEYLETVNEPAIPAVWENWDGRISARSLQSMDEYQWKPIG